MSLRRSVSRSLGIFNELAANGDRGCAHPDRGETE